MGVFKKVFGGGMSVASAPQVEVAPAPQAVTSSETAPDTADTTKKKKRSGFSSTQSSSMLDSQTTDARQTLG